MDTEADKRAEGTFNNLLQRIWSEGRDEQGDLMFDHFSEKESVQEIMDRVKVSRGVKPRGTGINLS